MVIKHLLPILGILGIGTGVGGLLLPQTAAQSTVFLLEGIALVCLLIYFAGNWRRLKTFSGSRSTRLGFNGILAILLMAGILTIGIWNTAIAMALWLGGLSYAPDSQRANYLFFLKPVIAAFLAIAILGDDLSWMQGLAIFAICFCVALEYVWTQARQGSKVAA